MSMLALLVIPLPTLRPVFSTGPSGEELASADTVVAMETCTYLLHSWTAQRELAEETPHH